MRGHSLMQAIARVNRVYKDKPGGRVVDYIGIASDLKQALVSYTQSNGRGAPAFEQEQAVEKMLEKHAVVAAMFNRFAYKTYFSADTQAKLGLILEAEEHVLGLENGKERFTREVGLLEKAFALSVPDPRAMAIKAEVGFFQAVKARLKNLNSKAAAKAWTRWKPPYGRLLTRRSSWKACSIYLRPPASRSRISLFFPMTSCRKSRA